MKLAPTGIKALKNKMNGLQAARSPYENMWRELAKYFCPSKMRIMNDINGSFYEENYINILNSTQLIAGDTFINAMIFSVTNPSKKWNKIGDNNQDKEFANRADVSKYLNELTDWAAYATLKKTNFYTQHASFYGDLAFFGSPCMIAEKNYDGDRFINFTSVTPGTYYVERSVAGDIQTFGRKISMPLHQIVDFFCMHMGKPDYSNLGPAMKNAAMKYVEKYDGGDALFEIHHIICRNKNHMGYIHKDEVQVIERNEDRPYTGLYYDPSAPDGSEPLKVDGYGVMPVMFICADSTNAPYAETSMGIRALGDVRELQNYCAIKSRIAELLAAPPITSDMDHVDISSGMINYKTQPTMNQEAKPIYEVNPNAITVLGNEIAILEDRIKKIFKENVFASFLQNDVGSITAEEVRAREAEKALLAGPLTHILNEGLLEPFVKILFSFAMDMVKESQIPLHDEIGLNLDGYGPGSEQNKIRIKPEFVSVMHQAQKMQEVGILQSLYTNVANMTPVYPEARHKINPIKMAQHYADALGVNPEVTRDDREIKKITDQEQEAMQRQQLGEAMEKSSNISKNLSQSQTGGDSVLNSLTQQG